MAQVPPWVPGAQFECTRLSAPGASDQATVGRLEEHLYLDSDNGSEQRVTETVEETGQERGDCAEPVCLSREEGVEFPLSSEVNIVRF